MTIKRTATKTFITLLVLGVIAVQSSQAFAWGGDPRRDRGREVYYTPHYIPHGRVVRDIPRGYMRLFMAGLEYYYWEGMFYRRYTDRYVVVQAPIGALVTAIPVGCQPVVVDGIPYYNINGVTYMYTPAGYQVVPQPKTIIVKNYPEEAKAQPVQGAAPAVTTAAQPAGAAANEEAFTVNIPNAKGGYTPVVLKRSGNGFVGPQGEYYAEFPKIEQLKVMYGK